MKLRRFLKWRLSSIGVGFKRIFSDFILNFIAAGVICPIFIRSLLYRIMGNKVGKKCALSPRIFLGPGKGRLTIGGYFYKL